MSWPGSERTQSQGSRATPWAPVPCHASLTAPPPRGGDQGPSASTRSQATAQSTRVVFPCPSSHGHALDSPKTLARPATDHSQPPMLVCTEKGFDGQSPDRAMWS